MKEAIFKAGVILIVCRVWAKQGLQFVFSTWEELVLSS
jgi:hypothetical protein